ncbi:MAG: glycosyltransferase family 9 protein [Phycisphaerales bacterium JB064]
MTHTSHRTDHGLTVIDACYDGLGDAITYAWIARTAADNGEPVAVNFGRWHDVAVLLDVEPWATFEHSDRYYTQRSGFSKHHLGEIEAVFDWHRDGGDMPTRFASWCAFFGVDGGQPSRPMYVEDERDAIEAEASWKAVREGLQKAGKAADGPVVVLSPIANSAERSWPMARWGELAKTMIEAGCVVAVVVPDGVDPKHFPAVIGTERLGSLFAIVQRADLVISGDSGLAHVGGTLGVATLVVAGGTDPAVVFSHMGEVVTWVGNDEMACTGCHWDTDKGYRRACQSGCQSLLTLSVDRVMDAADARLEVRR